jgi:hypothetical protein
MARGGIVNYRVEWTAQHHRGALTLRVWTGATTIESFTIPITNVQEMQLLIDVVRNEKPLSYDSDTMTISTGDEMVGEGDK